MIEIFGLIIALSGLVSIIYFCMWMEHKASGINNYHLKKFGYASYKTFLQKFNQYEATYKLNISEDGTISVFDYSKSNHNTTEKVWIYSNVIRFDDIHMIINFLDYWQFLVWRYKYVHSHKSSRQITWSNDND